MQLKTVIFDLDDTLYTDWDTCHAAGIAAVDAYGVACLNLAPREMEQAFLSGRRRAIQLLGETGSCHNRVLFAQFGLEQIGVNPVLHAENLHQAYWHALYETMVVDPHAAPLLDALHAAGIQTAVCTNMMTDVQMRKLNRLGLADKIDCFVTSEEAGTDKPNAEIFRYVLEKAGCAADETMMVGDNFVHDICGAATIGIPGIWLNRKKVQLPIGEISPAFTVRSLGEAALALRMDL